MKSIKNWFKEQNNNIEGKGEKARQTSGAFSFLKLYFKYMYQNI